MFHPFAHVSTWKQIEKTLAEGRIELAESHLRTHLRAYPHDAEAWILQGYLAARAERLEQAEQYYRQALLLQPQHPFMGQYLLACYADPEQDDAHLLLKMRQAVEQGAFEPLEGDQISHPSPAPGERLQVGYLSREMGIFSSATTLLPLLENHDHSRFELFAYSDFNGEDILVRRFQACFEHWCASALLSETALFERMRADGIQILIDLSGLIHSSRLCLLTRRPTPIQLTGLGFGWPTALPEMDGFFTDPRLWQENMLLKFF